MKNHYLKLIPLVMLLCSIFGMNLPSFGGGSGLGGIINNPESKGCNGENAPPPIADSEFMIGERTPHNPKGNILTSKVLSSLPKARPIKNL